MINNRLTRSGLTSSAEVLRDLGLNVGNDQRAAERVSAAQSRMRAGRDEIVRRVRDLALAVHKARRHCQLAEGDWRPDPVRAAIVS